MTRPPSQLSPLGYCQLSPLSHLYYRLRRCAHVAVVQKFAIIIFSDDEVLVSVVIEIHEGRGTPVTDLDAVERVRIFAIVSHAI